MKKSKGEGGLGFRDFHAMNIALIGKQVWRIHRHHDALWVRLLKSLYFPNCNIWEARVGRASSWAWRSIIKGRNSMSQQKAWLIKDGSQVKAFGEKWLVNGGQE